MMNIAKMMQQAKRMQDDMKTMQDKLKTVEVQGGISGVSITMFGNGQIKAVSIDPSLMDDKETLEDVLVASLNQTRDKMEEMAAAETQKIMGGLKLPPGMSLPF